MKTNHCFKLNPSPRRTAPIWVLLLAALFPATFALAQDEAAPPGGPPRQAATAESSSSEQTSSASNAAETTAKTGTATSNGIDMNFQNASIDQVLDHLAKAAGFIIVKHTSVVGRVSITGKSLTQQEAVDLLNSELNRNNYAAIRNGRTLTIMTKEEAVVGGNPVIVGNDPDKIPSNDELVTQIIPIRYVEAQQLITDVSPFTSTTRIAANQAGNSIIVTDTQANIKHLLEIIKAIDSSAEDVTEVRVFPLKYADPTDTANLLMGLFPDQTGASSPIRFGGGGRGGRGGFGNFGGARGGRNGGFNPFAAVFGAQGSGNSQADRVKERKQVVAVADPRTASVIVTATSDVMAEVEKTIQGIDREGKRVRMVVIPVNHANPYDVAQALQNTVGASSRTTTQNTQDDLLKQRLQTFQNQYGTSSSISSGGVGGGGGGRGGRIGQ